MPRDPLDEYLEHSRRRHERVELVYTVAGTIGAVTLTIALMVAGVWMDSLYVNWLVTP